MCEKIILNCARCQLCGDVLVSDQPRHQKCCQCLALCINGGKQFIMRSVKVPARDMHDTDYMSEVVEEMTEYQECTEDD